MNAGEDRTWHALVLHPDDDVAVALRDLRSGEEIELRRGESSLRIVVRDPIPLGHKFALHALAAGAVIRKYGEVIGAATAPIQAGAYVHVHNLASMRARHAR